MRRHWLPKRWSTEIDRLTQSRIVFSLFVIYQMATFAVTHSMMMLFLTAVNLVIIALLPPEHRRLSLEIRNQNKK